MERWLWFVLIAAVGYAAYDYGRKTEREPTLRGTVNQLSAAVDAYRERDELRAQLSAERASRDRAIADAAARATRAGISERVEAVEVGLDRCPIAPDLERLRAERDADANARITAAYGHRNRAAD